MNSGSHVRNLRKRRGEKLKDVSAKTGISISYLSDIERGRAYPSLSILYELASHFNVPPCELLGYQEDIISRFDDRELAEIKLCQHYAENPHGTSGHHRMILIAKLAEIINL